MSNAPRPSATLVVSALDVVLLTDVLDYVADHFEAEDAETAQMFQLACATMRRKLDQVRPDLGLPALSPPASLSDMTTLSDDARTMLARSLATDRPTTVH